MLKCFAVRATFFLRYSLFDIRYSGLHSQKKHFTNSLHNSCLAPFSRNQGQLDGDVGSYAERAFDGGLAAE